MSSEIDSNYILPIMFLLYLLGACSLTFAIELPGKLYYDLDDAPNLFQEFVQKYNKVYNSEEYSRRLHIFKENLKEINEQNAKQSLTKFAINHFADLTAEEREGLFGFLPLDDSFHKEAVHLDIPDEQIKDLPDSFDWRDHNVVTSVKEQGICGSSYIFSAIANIESQYAIKNNKTLDLSEQQPLDCMDPYDTVTNCHGGYPHTVMSHDLDGAVLARDYNYTGKPAVCFEEVLKPAVKVDTVTFYKPTEKSLMKLLVEKGPLSVALQGTGLLWYHKDIVWAYFQCYGAVNHVVLLVGYGEEGGVPYWILKNSWSEKWGEDGYFRLLRGADACFMGTSYTATCTVV